MVCILYHIPEVKKMDISSDKTYTSPTLSNKEIVDNHKSVISSFGLFTKDDNYDLLSMYWIPKLHKNPHRQGYIAGFAKCTTKPLSKL